MAMTNRESNSELIAESIASSFLELRTTSTDFKTIDNEMRVVYQTPESWYAVGYRLQQILNKRLYREENYLSFSDYCSRGLGYSRQHAYKLIKVVSFIDQQWEAAAETTEQMRVHRLFALGFTKLYILHTFSSERIDQMLQEGINITIGTREYQYRLEEVTIGQLKRALKSARLQVTHRGRVADSALTLLLESQARRLLQLIDQCHTKINDRDALSELLQLMRQDAETLANGINAIYR